MKAADATGIKWENISGHRSGLIEFRRLLQGHTGAPDNFELSLVRTGSDYYTPRHRHNFDQIRYCLTGEMTHSPGKTLPAGAVGYFPEGTHYGPQTEKTGTILLLLQFGGASGSGFMSYDQLTRGFESLRASGQFDKGTFAYKDENGVARRKDGYEAVWEHVNGRKVEYPKPRFDEPVVMYPDGFEWLPVAGQPGVGRKLLAEFSERQIETGFLKIVAGATYRSEIDAPVVYFVAKGALRHQGRTYGVESAFMFEPADRKTTLTAADDAEVFVAKMPRFDRE